MYTIGLIYDSGFGIQTCAVLKDQILFHYSYVDGGIKSTDHFTVKFERIDWVEECEALKWFVKNASIARLWQSGLKGEIGYPEQPLFTKFPENKIKT